LGLNQKPEYGGQGAPDVLRSAASDYLFGANISFCLGALLTTGAAHMIERIGSDDLKKTYVSKMLSGEWSGTMCLTEPGAGTDVGASLSKAIPDGNSYLIQSEKIFITNGDNCF